MSGNRHRTADSQRRQRSQDGKVDELRQSVIAGVAALDRGDYTDVEDTELDAYLDGLTAESR